MLLATASASNATNTLPPLDLSWAITATIAVVAFLSPIVVAIINNHHSRIMRQMDIAHQETIKKNGVRYCINRKAILYLLR